MSDPINEPVIEVEIRPTDERDLLYCHGSWAESYKLSPGNERMPWGLYKRTIKPELRVALDDAEVIGAFWGDEIVGWIAVNRGKRVNALHWVHTRFKLVDSGVELRRRGIMTALVDAAKLGSHIVYTHRGPLPRSGTAKRPADAWLVPWLASRGTYATHVHYQEWKK